MRKTFRLTGLFALAFSAMAFSATAAQAEPGAVWNVNGSPVTNELKAQVQVTEIETLPATGVKEGILLTKSGFTTIEILCTEMKFVDALLTTLGGATGKIHFSSCVTKLNKGEPAAACVPHSPGAANGLIETNALDGLIKLHKELIAIHNPEKQDEEKLFKIYEQFELLPTAGETFATLQFGTGECSIGNNIEIKGKAFLKAGTETEGKEETKSKLFSEGLLSALLFGANPATIDGSAKAALVAPHAEMTFSGKAA